MTHLVQPSTSKASDGNSDRRQGAVSPGSGTLFTGKRIHLTGIVQGVGFRPFVYRLATQHGLRGWVCNTSAGVVIQVDGTAERIDDFITGLSAQAPSLSHVDSISVVTTPPAGFTDFVIRKSAAQSGEFQPTSPDTSPCVDCRRELFDPFNRRFRYPFINCTNCGPRFTIIQELPYDRPRTTMAGFGMCPECAQEYRDPLNRRFHAQPNACPICGPQVWLLTKDTGSLSRGESQEARVASRPHRFSSLVGDAAVWQARRLLAEGKIVGVKGIGGFHLACSAVDTDAVAELRHRKGRVDKPFALMVATPESVEPYCEVGPEERRLLESVRRPIVLLRKRIRQPAAHPLSPLIAPGQSALGVMLPYSPLHCLLLEPAADFPPALVMTSGNLSEEPIATDNEEAWVRLKPLADVFLLHDRDIHIGCDDSVVRIFESRELPVRRSRGYAPHPVWLPFQSPPILATGAELKNSFCVTRGDYAFLSQHIGNLENFETLKSFESSVAHFESLFRTTPELIAYDLHPDFLTTRYALDRAEREGIPGVGVQHHHAHTAACMAENGLTGERAVLGVAFDGTGYGTDGAVWGGEFLAADYSGFERVAHLAYVPLPGGDAATRKPYRVALSYLRYAGIEWAGDLPPVAAASDSELAAIDRQITSGLNTPLTSSLGRLFDAIASLVGVRQHVNYEGQAAIELESVADEQEGSVYPFPIKPDLELRLDTLIREVVADLRAGASVAHISARFHNTIATMVRDVALLVRDQRGVNEIVLSGGVYQNVKLLKRTQDLLRAGGFSVYTHRLVPPNDGGLALGQAVIAAQVARKNALVDGTRRLRCA